MDTHQLVTIFCQLDDFCKELDQYVRHKALPSYSTGRRGPACSLAESEIMTILVAFQYSGFKNFKCFYTGFVFNYWKSYFKTLPSYQRMIELIPRLLLHLTLFSQIYAGKKTGIYYIDSTVLPACHLKRSKRNKVFKHVAQYGKSSMGWFFGLKLHLIINDRGALIAFKLTPGNQSDSASGESLMMSLSGMAFGDKGYIGKALAERLMKNSLKLITRTRKNMKPHRLSKLEKQLLNQRGIIETVIDHLKHHYQLWHTRHRSVVNAMVHLVAALSAYAMSPMKLSAIKLLTN